MRITPLDVRKQEFRKAVRGLDADEVYAFLATVADEYEVVLTDNKKLRDRVIELDEKVGEYRNMEKTLRDTLLTAERVMTEARQNARKEADLILRDAQMKASQEVSGINGRVESLHQQMRELRGHRDSYLARLQSLSEAQLGLIDSYRKDFENSDHRMERGGDETPGRPSRPAAAPRQAAADPAQGIPAWDRPSGSIPVARSEQPDDRWRGYDVRDEASSGQRGPDSRPHLHTPRPAPEVLELDAPEFADAEAPMSEAEYDARIASVADAWSGSVPRVRSENLPEGEARAIDEVSAALGMFSEGSADLPEPASLEGESHSRPVVRVEDRPGDRARELAPDRFPTESVGHAGGADQIAPESIEASAGSRPDEQPEDGESRWSLSRIARGLTGH